MTHSPRWSVITLALPALILILGRMASAETPANGSKYPVPSFYSATFLADARALDKDIRIRFSKAKVELLAFGGPDSWPPQATALVYVRNMDELVRAKQIIPGLSHTSLKEVMREQIDRFSLPDPSNRSTEEEFNDLITHLNQATSERPVMVYATYDSLDLSNYNPEVFTSESLYSDFVSYLRPNSHFIRGFLDDSGRRAEPTRDRNGRTIWTIPRVGTIEISVTSPLDVYRLCHMPTAGKISVPVARGSDADTSTTAPISATPVSPRRILPPR